MVDAQTFLTDFCKDLVGQPMERQELIAGYAKILRLRDQSNQEAGIRRVLELPRDEILDNDKNPALTNLIHAEDVEQLLEEAR